MLMKVFPHGTEEGDKPSRYLVRPDYPGRYTAPPQILRGDLAMTRALIDSIERRWKFTSGALSWHPNDKVSEEQEEESWMPSSEWLSPGWKPTSAISSG